MVKRTRIIVTFIRTLLVVFITGTKYVYCAVRIGSLNIIQGNLGV